MRRFPLPLPRAIQEMILAKLPLHDLVRSRLVCKYWRRIASTKSFQRLYGAAIVPATAKPWFLTILSRVAGFLMVCDSYGKLRYRILNDDGWNEWMPTSNAVSIASISRGLLLILDKTNTLQIRCTVVNPLTRSTKNLPALDMDAESEISYAEIVCSEQDSSYKVLVMGMMNADKESGVLYGYKIMKPDSMPFPDVPDGINGYLKPFMSVYCSDSGSWTSSFTFPAGLIFPSLGDEQKSIIIDKLLYCVTTPKPQSWERKIACFDINKMEWSPVLVDIPGSFLCFMPDVEKKLMLVVASWVNGGYSTAAIEGNRVVIKRAIKLPKEVYPKNEVLFDLMEVWGFGDSLFLHVPVNHRGGAEWGERDKRGHIELNQGRDIEPKVHNWFFNLRNSDFQKNTLFEDLPIGSFLSKASDHLKLAYFPSIRAP